MSSEPSRKCRHGMDHISNFCKDFDCGYIKQKKYRAILKNGEVLYSNDKFDFYDENFNIGKNVLKIEET